MTYEEIKAAVESTNKGSIHTLSYSRPLKTRKGVSDSISKRTVMQCRFGVRYDNIKTVKEDRANGILPAENQGLHPSLRWVDENFIENVNNGNKMLRVANANGNKVITIYFKNGIEVSKEEIVSLCLASEFKGEQPTVQNIGIEKIERIV